MDVVKKEAAGALSGDLQYVMSDATIDRYGDVVEPDGWDLRSFLTNPIALFNHDKDFVIGRWENVRVAGGRLIGKLVLAEEGTSERINEVIRLVRQGMLRAVSVGFRPKKAEPLQKGGVRFLAQELLETSLVSVPANPNAVQLAKSLNVSDATIRLVFGENADEAIGIVRRHGENAANRLPTSRTQKMNLSQRIEAAQTDLVREKDLLTAHVAEDDADPIVTEELTSRVEQKQAAVDALKRAETALMAKSAAPSNQLPAASPGRVPAVAAKKVEPKDYVYRSMAAQIIAHVNRLNAADVLRASYGEDEATRLVFDHLTRAATAPATTTTTGWAIELVQTAFGDFIETLMPNSIYPTLAAAGGRFTFGRAGKISLPSRASTPTVAGSFVAEGSPIPVRQAGFNAITLTPKKMGVITTMTREIAEHSTPAIEGLLRQAIQEDTAVAIDTVLLDATAASSTRPAGLRNGVSVTTATSGGGFAALVGDIKALVGALMTGSGGNVRRPVWIMNPAQALAISLTQNAGGDFPFADELTGGTLRGYPVIQSTTVAAGMMILIDAADFFSATGDVPSFTVSDQATLHMEDTSPAAIGTAGSPNVVAAPVRSLFQTDSLGLRMILDINWALRRSGTVAWTQSVTW